jgi:phosphoribosylanthranilate isomerase
MPPDRYAITNPTASAGVCLAREPLVALTQVARIRTKICGVMRPHDAAAACRHGADAVGIVLHEASARHVPIETAREIIAALNPFVTPVGVFVDSKLHAILDAAAMLGIHTVQLNGPQTPDDVAELAGLAVIKAIRVKRGELAAQLEMWKAAKLPNLIGVVMEPGGTKLPGGTGVANDWDEIIAAQRSGAFGGLPVVAAGGLTPENVAQVVRDLRPYAVDVSSGVESVLGEKSEEKIRRFIEETRVTS